ncbi:hypothetical protein RRF57_003192 [Xylaria bambusicola]|uniref:Uncharacterized protein n=1 Tax=Xylaria bambusicola TaxID=326684 RepID=A0AAN7UG86_9PEZI
MPKYMRESLLTHKAIGKANESENILRFLSTNTSINRAIHGRRSRLEKIPIEIKLMIIGFIPDGASIINLSLSGPDFCSVVCTHEKKIVEDAMTIIPPSLMYLAVANYMISTAPWHVNKKKEKRYGRGLELSEAYGTLILNFVEQYRHPEDLTLEKKHPGGLTLSQAKNYLKTYIAVSYYANLLSKQAMFGIPEKLDLSLQITCTVLARYEKALYIMQLVSSLFSWQGAAQPQNQIQMAWGVFWYSLFPWEAEQIFCVQRLLERHIGTLATKHRTVQGYEQSSLREKIFISKFVVFMGPLALWQVEVAGRSPMSFSVELFLLAFKVNEFLSEGVCLPDFGSRVTLPRAIRKLESSQRDEIDQGPLESWYCMAMVTFYGTLFRNMKCRYSQRTMIYRGYMLLDPVHPKGLPPMPGMKYTLARYIHQLYPLREDLKPQVLVGFPIVDITSGTTLVAIAESRRILRRLRSEHVTDQRQCRDRKHH